MLFKSCPNSYYYILFTQEVHIGSGFYICATKANENERNEMIVLPPRLLFGTGLFDVDYQKATANLHIKTIPSKVSTQNSGRRGVFDRLGTAGAVNSGRNKGPRSE